jgi:predicted ribosomally synthesized peptide with SipW-like signal peptide
VTDARRYEMLKKVLAAAAGAVLAMSIGAASAYFTTQIQVPDNYIQAGKKISVSTEPTSSAIYVDDLVPGAAAVRPLRLENDGDTPVDVRMSVSKKAGYTDFYESLTCKVSHGDLVLYRGPLAALRTAPLRLAARAQEDLKVEVGFNPAGHNYLPEHYVKLSFVIDAEQAH